MILIDTSAFYALLDGGDNNHLAAKRIFLQLLDAQETLLTHNYMVVETCALVQRRLGIRAVQAFQLELLPLLKLHWVNETTHQLAIAALLAAQSNKVSLVDRISFQIMRDYTLEVAFAFDQDFLTEGFRIAG